MKATIWHNPNCGTSRNTLAMLQDAGAEVTVIEYLKKQGLVFFQKIPGGGEGLMLSRYVNTDI